MKVLVAWEPLRDALQLIAHLVPGKSTSGEPSFVHIQADESMLVLSAADDDCVVRREISEAVDTKEPGSVTLPVHLLSEFVRDLSQTTVTLVGKDEEMCTVTAGEDKLEAVCILGVEPEPMPEIDTRNSFEVEAQGFTKQFESCAFAAAREDRRGLHGVRMEVTPDRLRLVATDTRRLAVADKPLDGGPENVDPCMLPTRIVGQMLSAIRASEGLLRITPLSTQVCFQVPGLTVLTRVIQAKFPEQYNSIIPRRATNICTFSPDQMMRKLRLVSTMSSQELPSVELHFDSSSVTLIAASPSQGKATAEVTVSYKGVVDRVKYNPDYLIEGLKKADLEEVQLEFEQANTPGKFTLGEGFAYVVMPITT